jgi:hypothetical protein
MTLIDLINMVCVGALVPMIFVSIKAIDEGLRNEIKGK